MEGELTMEMVKEMNLPPVIALAVPTMVTLVAIEYVIGLKRNLRLYRGSIFWPSVGVGIGNLLANAAVKGIMFATVLFFYNAVPWSIPHTWWSYILCLVVLDFFRYWAHRIAHEQRLFWATHVTHHSGEDYNFSVSFRLSWTQQIKLLFFLPVAMMGFHPLVFFIIHQSEVLYQYWIHTELIRKLPRPIEYIFTTPSHHRVHHAINDKYLDKNYGSTFIIWDRMFGTFQPEEEQAVYGITKPVKSKNPFTLVFHEWVDIFKDVAYFKSWKDKLKVLISAPGQMTRPEPDDTPPPEVRKEKQLESVMLEEEPNTEEARQAS